MGSSRRQGPRELLGIAEPSRRSRRHAHLDPEPSVTGGGGATGALHALALEMANRYHDLVHATIVSAIERHPGDFEAAVREAVHGFLFRMRDERLAYADLCATDCWLGLRPSLAELRARQRERLVELWAGYHQRVNGLDRRDARGLSSFQCDGLRGLALQIDSGRLGADAAITLFIDVLTAAAERLGERSQPLLRSRRSPCAVRPRSSTEEAVPKPARSRFGSS